MALHQCDRQIKRPLRHTSYSLAAYLAAHTAVRLSGMRHAGKGGVSGGIDKTQNGAHQSAAVAHQHLSTLQRYGRPYKRRARDEENIGNGNIAEANTLPIVAENRRVEKAGCFAGCNQAGRQSVAGPGIRRGGAFGNQ